MTVFSLFYSVFLEGFKHNSSLVTKNIKRLVGAQRISSGNFYRNRLPSDPTKIPPVPYRETRVAKPLSHCVSCAIEDYRCYTPSFLKKKWPIAVQRQV